MTSQAIPPIPAFVVVGPQQFDSGRASGFALIVAAAIAGPGSVPASNAIFGQHAVPTHNAETLKTKIWPSVATPPPGRALLGSWVGAAPQAADLTQQPVYDAPQVRGATPRISSFVASAPQALDLTQQPFYDAPQPAGATLRVSSYVRQSLQAFDPTQQPFYDAPLIGTPLSGSIPAAQFVFGTHAAAIYNAEAIKTRVWPSVTAAPSVSGILGRWYSASPQSVDLTQQAFYDAPVVSQGWIISYTTAGPDPTEYPLIRGYLTPTAVQGLAPGVLLGTLVTVSQQAYVDIQPKWYPAAVAGNTPRIGAFFSVWPTDPTQLAASYRAPLIGSLPNVGPVPPRVQSAPQLCDFTQQSFYDAPQVSGWTPRVPQIVQAAPQQSDFTQQSFYDAPLVGVSIGLVPRSVWSPPQPYDFTQQPVYDAPQVGPLIGPVPPPVRSAPQSVDLTQQSSYSRPLIIGQGTLGTYTQVPPQQWDYTLPSFVFEPLVARIVYVIRAPQRLELGDYGRRIKLGSYTVRID